MKILYVTTIGATMGFFVNFIDEAVASETFVRFVKIHKVLEFILSYLFAVFVVVVDTKHFAPQLTPHTVD